MTVTIGRRYREQRVATPLRRNRPILDMEQRMLESGNGVDPRQLRIKVADQSFRIMRICPI